MILVITSDNDRTADDVVGELVRRGVSTTRFDVADFPGSVTISGRLDDECGWKSNITHNGHRVDLVDVAAIYYRRPRPFVFPDDLADSDLSFASAEARRGFGGLLFSLSTRWVNHPSRVADAEFKPAQLHAAARLGLTVPRTVITNSPEDARRFCETVENGVVYKPLSAANIVSGDDMSLVFTTRLASRDIDDACFSLTANLLQEWIPKRYDARVTAVGATLFGVAIHAGSPDAYLDWRIDYPSLNYEPIDVPDEVARGIVAYLAHFDLLYGAFDFSITEDQWYFLECNANGQYGWIEAATGLPITAAIADLLTETHA